MSKYPLGLRWYLVRTERQHERMAAEAIADLAIEIYLPLETHFATYNRKLKRVTLPLFRGYLFTRFDAACGAWGGIRRARGVDDVVCANEIPLRVPDEQLHAIRMAERDGYYDSTRRSITDDDLACGSKVRIIGGPFAGRIGEVARASPRRRVEILFYMLGQKTRIRVDRVNVARAA